MSSHKIRPSKPVTAARKATVTPIKAAVKAATAAKGAPAQTPAKAATATQAPTTPATTAQKAIAAPTAAPTSDAAKPTPYAQWADGLKSLVRIPDSQGGGYTSHDVGSLEEAQRLYRRLQNGASGKLEAAAFYTNGLKVATINTRGVAIDAKGAIIAGAPTLEEARTAIDQKAEQLEPAQSVIVPAHFMSAALAVASKKDQARPYLCSVYVHQVGDQLRVVAGDGHRIMVLSQSCGVTLGWGEKGVMLGRDDLERIAKFIGKGEAAEFEISFGVNHQHAVIREVGGIGTFTVTPLDGKYVEYQRVLDTLQVFNGGERRPTEATCMNPAYMKAAGAIAAVLESPGVYAFMDDATGPCAFTFEGVSGAVLIVMPIRVERPQAALPAATVRLLGPQAIKGSIAALKAHATRTRKAIEATTDKGEIGRLEAQLKGYTDRAAELAAAISVKIEGKATIVPDAPKEEAAATAQ